MLSLNVASQKARQLAGFLLLASHHQPLGIWSTLLLVLGVTRILRPKPLITGLLFNVRDLSTAGLQEQPRVISGHRCTVKLVGVFRTCWASIHFGIPSVVENPRRAVLMRAAARQLPQPMMQSIQQTKRRQSARVISSLFNQEHRDDIVTRHMTERDRASHHR